MVAEVGSEIVGVVVHADGALVTRGGRVALPAGVSQVRLPGLPLSLDPRTLRATATGAEVVDVRREVRTTLLPEGQVEELQDELDRCEAACATARTALARAQARAAEAAALRAVPPPNRRGEPPRPAPVEGLLALADFVDARLAALQQEVRAAGRRVEEADRALELARAARFDASTALPSGAVRNCASVLLTIRQAVAATVGFEVEYGVPAAAWTPAYRLRLDPESGRGTLELRALVAQRSTEDWTGVQPALSTADLQRRTDVPELKSLRLGRRQQEPVVPLLRRPPVGTDSLFAGYDEAPRPAASRSSRSRGLPMAVAAGGAVFEEVSDLAADAEHAQARPRAARRMADHGAGYGGPPPAPGAVPAPAMALAAAPQPPGGPVPPPPPPPTERAVLDYAALTLAGPDDPGARGALVPAPQVHAEAAAPPRLPAGAVRVRESAGAYDYRFDAAAPVDLPADGGWHSVGVGEFPVGIATEYLTVPSAEQRVYATVVVDNSSGLPVLAGPAEVVLAGAYLTTVPFPTLAPGRSRRVGIGVAEEIRVARTLHVTESASGLRSSTTVLEHRLTVELANQLPRPAVVEVQERVPVSDDRDVRIEDLPTDPPWRVVEPREDESHRRGLRVWRVTLAPGESVRLTGGWTVRIPAGKAVVGGNRREA